MLINPYLFDGTGSDVFGIIGDSNADGRGETIPTVSTNTLFLSNGSVLTEITTQSVANDDNTKGSAWQQFATDYKTSTGRKTILVQGASGGAEFYPNGDNNNWYTSGTLYAAWKTKMDNTLTLTGKSLPKAIFIILGINDARSSNTLANINTGITSLISRLTTDYPGVPLVFSALGRSEGTTSADTTKVYNVRVLMQDAVQATTDAYMCANLFAFTGTGMMQVDNLHFTQSGYNAAGAMFARWMINTSYSKWARAVISSHFDELSTNRKTLIANFIDSQVANGNYFDFEQYTLSQTTTANNAAIDWVFLNYNLNNGATFNANNSLQTTGSTASHFITSYTPLNNNAKSSNTDVIVGARVGTIGTASGTPAILFGCGGSGTGELRFAQGINNVNYAVNCETIPNGTDVNIQSNNLYAIARDGGTQYLLKNGSVVNSSADAVTTQPLNAVRWGMFLNNTTAQFPIQAHFKAVFAAKYTTFDVSSFFTEQEYLIAHWND
jgi:hypothetical protein